MQEKKNPVKLPTLLTKAKKLLKTQTLMKSHAIEDSVKDGREWFYGFSERMEKQHGIRLCLRNSAPIENVRIPNWRWEHAYEFYDSLWGSSTRTGLSSLRFHEGAKFIVNFDETPIPAEGIFRGSRIIVVRGERKEYRIDGNSSVKHITVVAAVTADGEPLPPILVFANTGVTAKLFAGALSKKVGEDVRLHQ